MRKANLAERIGGEASVYMAATLEYLLAELMAACAAHCVEDKKKRITPRHILLGIRMDEDLNELLKNVIIPCGGVIPFIEPELLPPSKTPTSDLLEY